MDPKVAKQNVSGKECFITHISHKKTVHFKLRYSLPEWTRDVFGDGSKFEWLGLHDFLLPTNTPLLTRLSTGFLIREILEHFTQKIESKLSPDRSIWIYSAHDTHIANILNFLGLFEVN